ncbi:AAA family ATPase [Neisseria sp.]|uniref:AAA family ATPase n=1 Tax=Neisseria sp. TaxID=192066 RepID=UPI00289E7FEB|nr:AAA family ATPase [Neisseria sp.]
MWISKIKLKNFKSYADAEFTFPEPSDNKNIVLIGAQNGHGKTTLLEAIYLSLYDKDAVSYFKRAGLSSDEVLYPRFLSQALFHEANDRFGLYQMELEIEIMQRKRGQLVGLRIGRKWFFNRNREWDGSNNEVRASLISDCREQPIAEEEIKHYLNDYALPFDYAPYFFFDGEKISQMAKGSVSGAGEWLGLALQGLLGVHLLGRLKDDLKRYRTSLISANASQRAVQDLQKAEKELSQLETLYGILKEQLEDALAEKRNLEEQFEELTAQLGGGSDIETSKDLLARKENLIKRRENLRNTVQHAVLALPLALLPSERLEKISNTLTADLNRLNHEAGRNQVSSRLEDFWQTFVGSDKVKEVLGRSAEVILQDPLMKEAVDDCWKRLFYPLPPNCADPIQHNYLSQQAIAKIQGEIDNLTTISSEKIEDVLAEINIIEHEEKQLDTRLEILRHSNHEDLIEQLKTVQQDLNESTNKVGQCESNANRQRMQMERKQQDVERLRSEIERNNPKLLKSKRAEKVGHMIEALSKELLKQKNELLSEAATRINHELYTDERIHKIHINDNGKMALFGRNGAEFNGALSAGQMQILIMSLVSALAEVTRYQAPFVIDTPLARLDNQRRNNLFRHWAKLNQQVILLSQDAEVTPAIKESLQAYVSKTYLVKADILDSVGARSNITENAYF